MSENLEPTHELAAPPRILLWGCIGLVIIGIVGSVASVYLFREVLRPGQQVRVMEYLPFMEAFLPPRPAADATVPTVGAPVNEDQINNLLTLDLEPQVTPEATPEVTPEPTVEVTVEATEVAVVASPTPAIVATSTPLPPPPTIDPALLVTTQRTWGTSHINTGFEWTRQGWNNCGPTTVTIAMTYYGWQRDQAFAAQFLKPDREDKNVSPWELATFVNEQSDLQALYRIGGDLDLLRTLVYNGFPVIIERGHMFEGYEWLGHYQAIAGYDDAQRVFFIQDSFLGEDNIETYDEVDRFWKEFNRTFVVIYDPTREGLLMSLLGDNHATLESSQEHAFEVAQEEARQNPRDAFAYFNMGSALVALGRYQEAARAYDISFSLEQIPWRMMWYQFGPFEAYYEMERYDDVLIYVESNLSNGGEYVEETYYWQGRALAAQGQTNAARSAYREALRRNYLFEDAQIALNALG